MVLNFTWSTFSAFGDVAATYALLLCIHLFLTILLWSFNYASLTCLTAIPARQKAARYLLEDITFEVSQANFSLFCNSYRETHKIVCTRNICGMLLCYKGKANQAWEN